MFTTIVQTLLSEDDVSSILKELKYELLLIDSTTITVGKTRLPWALFHGECAGIKLHVAFEAATEQPVHVIETIGTVHDSSIGEKPSLGSRPSKNRWSIPGEKP
ncbi:transposase [Cohnella silvisoli]|uniref:Transposase n=1 Tax=Cohnella silvisoli TaxID=2873699 RepID=A0ABV1KMB4_9BACL|nr:transposase [Cohnella silvisoli]